MQQDDDNDLWRRMEQEFGPRRPNDPDAPSTAPPPTEPSEGPRRPTPAVATGQQRRLALPLFRPRAVYVLLVINVALWVVPALLDALGLGQVLTEQLFGISDVGLTQLIQALGVKSNSAIYRDGEFYRLLSSTFLHGGLLHIAFNGFAIYALGTECERLYGTGRFLAVYFAGGLGGSVASYALNASPSLGASGAVFGIAGGLAAFYYLLRDLLGASSKAQLNNIIGILVINLVIGLTASASIDNWAHLGGLVGGGLMGLILTPRYWIDYNTFPPRLQRRGSLALVWSAAGALLLAIWLLAQNIVPPLP